MSELGAHGPARLQLLVVFDRRNPSEGMVRAASSTVGKPARNTEDMAPATSA